MVIWLAAVLSGCARAAQQPPTATAVILPTVTAASTVTPAPAPEASPTPEPTMTSAPAYPPEGMGPESFLPGFNPLTGLPVVPENLERRPILVKVENLPRNHRPQFGLSRADLVFEYYTEEGTTRFAALFYGQNAEKVAPIRSARYVDIRLVQGYKAILVFGGAYEKLWNRLVSSDFGSRLLVEGYNSCPALCRYDPDGSNLLMADTTRLRDLVQARSIENSRQQLTGMFFQMQPPAGGQAAQRVFVRYSGAIYNRWDYDPFSGRYLRFVDAEDDLSHSAEVYVPAVDRLDGSPIAADNLVVVQARYFQADANASGEVLDVELQGSGAATLFRDGHAYALRWQREKAEDVLSLTGQDGQPFPFKPGSTWFELISTVSPAEQHAEAWRFTFAR